MKTYWQWNAWCAMKTSAPSSAHRARVTILPPYQLAGPRRSRDYFARIDHLITTRNVRLPFQDPSCIRINQRLCTCCKLFHINLAAYKVTVSRKFQTRLQSCERTRKLIDYRLPRFTKLVKEILHPVNALLVLMKQSMDFIPIPSIQSDVHCVGLTKPRIWSMSCFHHGSFLGTLQRSS